MSSINENPLYVFALLNLSIFCMEWISHISFFKYFGTALLVIIAGAFLANLGIIPTASNSIPLYDGIFTYLAPLSIFYLLLGVNLNSLKKAGLPMLTMFFLGAAGTAIGAFVGINILDGTAIFGDNNKAIAGMFTGTYIGGSVNFNALAIHYNMMEKGNIYAGAVAVDNIITTLWMVFCIAAPKILNVFRKNAIQKDEIVEKEIDINLDHVESDAENISPKSIGMLLFLGAATIFLSDLVAESLSNLNLEIPTILIVTTIALILAQFKSVSQLRGSKLLGLYSVYLFLIVIGAYCEIAAMSSIGVLAINLLFFAVILVVVHALFVFGIGMLLKYDNDLLAIASQANVGGSSTALALARSLNRKDLLLPGILVGSLGNGVGTYIAFIVAGLV